MDKIANEEIGKELKNGTLITAKLIQEIEGRVYSKAVFTMNMSRSVGKVSQQNTRKASKNPDNRLSTTFDVVKVNSEEVSPVGHRGGKR